MTTYFPKSTQEVMWDDTAPSQRILLGMPGGPEPYHGLAHQLGQFKKAGGKIPAAQLKKLTGGNMSNGINIPATYPVTQPTPTINQAGIGGLVPAAAGALSQLPAWAAKIAPYALPILGAIGLGGLFGGDDEEGVPAGIGEAMGMKWPWETPGGEGFIAPWSEAYQGPTGLWYQQGAGFQPVQVAPGEWILKRWDNGSARLNLPPTVQFYKTNRRVFYQVLSTGEWGTFRPRKNIVLSSNPRLSMVKKYRRAEKRLNKVLRKVK